MEGHPLDEIEAFEPYRGALASLGFETLEDVSYTAQVAAPELAAYLGVDSVDDLLASAPSSPAAIAQDTLARIRNATYSLGVEVDAVPRLSVVPSIAAPAATPANVNHIPDLPPVRDQGARGTCVAHAALAAYEHYLATLGADHDLSEQFLYWACKGNDGIPQKSGTWLGVAFPLLQRDGCCLESTWGYNPQPIAGNEGQAPPPGGAQLEALNYRMGNFREIAPTSVDDIKVELARGRCVAFSIPVFNSWYGNERVAATGDIGNPLPHSARRGGHAMCLVGYLNLPDKPALGGGRFILRNSWGENWGVESPYGAGYGTIPYSYIARFCLEAFSVA